MSKKPSPFEILFMSTAIGLVATLSAPWAELRGTFESWRLVEWHTFWRGDFAFLLSDVVAPNYHVPVEFATADTAGVLRVLALLGSLLAVWYVAAFVLLLALGARRRLRSGVPLWRVGLEMAALFLVNFLVLFFLAQLLALPSSRTLKVDFRTPGDVHTDSLIWSSVSVLPLSPLVALVASAAGVLALFRLPDLRRVTRRPLARRE